MTIAEASPSRVAEAIADLSGPPSIWVQVWRDTIHQVGARCGLFWIVLLVGMAALAPALANSAPLLLKANGHWSSPALHYLTPPDVILLLLLPVTLTLMGLRTISAAKRALAWLAFTALLIPACYLLVHPPITRDWQEYRDMQQAGEIQHVVWAPIVFSAEDFSRDVPDIMLQPPSWKHPLGTDADGGDVLSRMIYATRIALSVGLISTGISLVIGIIIGALMGYFVGWMDLFGMRLIEMFEAIPTLFLLITFVAFFGRNLYIIMAIIGLTGWTSNARFIRAEFLRLREQDFVQAAIAGGVPLRSILFRHLLPNGVSPLLVTASFGVASAILYESVLSFLGLGVVDEPSWGQMLNQARGVGGAFVWWIALFPGLAIFLTVYAYNLLGESLRDALDPKLLKD